MSEVRLYPNTPPGFPENQLRRELMTVSGLNPFSGHDSSSRGVMFCSHVGQYLIVNGLTERRIQTGMEREYGKYTFNTKAPANLEVISVVKRYQQTIDKNSINMNPQVFVIYEDMNSNEIGMINIENFCSNHPSFGFEYKKKAAMNKLRKNEFIPEGTVFQDSPAVTADGGYMYGVECNVAYMSHPAVSEDGIMISRDVLKKFAFKKYEKRVVSFGQKRFPLNLYGDDKNYKPFPDIGDRIRGDGALMALRGYDRMLSVIDQSQAALSTIDMFFDKITYADGPGGRIVDIVVHHELDSSQPGTPEGMDEQPLKYDRARRRFYKEIYDEYLRLKGIRKEALKLTPEFSRFVEEAISIVDRSDANKVQKLFRREPLDDWRIEFVIEYEVVPNIGFKLTDCHGGKGVICKIAEPHEMPVDQFGNRADIVMDGGATISRMNIGRMYEQELNAMSRDVVKNIRARLQLPEASKVTQAQLQQLDVNGAVSAEWDYLMGYYQIISPDRMYKWFTTGMYEQSKYNHLESIINRGIYLYIPPDNTPTSVEMMEELLAKYSSSYGPVSYIGNSGKVSITKDNVAIGSMYFMLLEKTGDDWTAVSSAKVQHHAVLAQVTSADKYSQPTRQQAIRAWGEAEVRILVSYAGPLVTAEILDRNNNMETHEAVCRAILQADKPTAIPYVVDRTKIPYGNSKPLQMVNHIGECAGWKFSYKPFVPDWTSTQMK